MIGTLWDVTDAEIDNFTFSFLDAVDEERDESMTQLLVQTKQIAYSSKKPKFLPHFTASSLVYYGVPVFQEQPDEIVYVCDEEELEEN